VADDAVKLEAPIGRAAVALATATGTRRYIDARGCDRHEFVDRGVSGAKEKRPALDALLKDAKRRRFDVLVCWRLDRLGRNLRHLVTLLEDLQHVGVSFVSLSEGIDCTTPAGRLQLHILAALAGFEKGRIRDWVMAPLERARTQGKRLGRPKSRPPVEPLHSVHVLSMNVAATQLGVSHFTLKRWRRQFSDSGWPVC
jgi:DNA invertase Pin-like site-specific DNA recombinase